MRDSLPARRRAENEKRLTRIEQLRLDPGHVDDLLKGIYVELNLRNDRLKASEKAGMMRQARLAFEQALFEFDDPEAWNTAARRACGLL